MPVRSVDECYDRLRRAGWSVGETVSATLWIVTGTNGENRVHAEWPTQSEARWRACEQAEAVGMLAKARELP
jgi:hypothetical protein